MRLRSSGMIAPTKARDVSGSAGGGTPGGSLESSRLAARCLDSRALEMTRFGIGHAFSERLRNPRIIILDDKLRDLRPFVGR